MKEIINNVYMLDGTNSSHVYFIKQNGNNILIDTGMVGLFKKIESELNSVDLNIKDINNILLTHHDIDHIGNAKMLHKASGAKLWISKEDMPYACGKLKRKGVKRIIQTLIRQEALSDINTYEEGQKFSKAYIIKTPGHTPGHVSVLYENVLFSGDLFKVKDKSIKLLPGFMNYSEEEIVKSIKALKKLKFEWICPSHGKPISAKEKSWTDFVERYQ
ncbi:beta-lactamase [Clostridium acetobutylicum]|nr:beta-lactamase [Clostridium acetobutylicum]